MAVAIRLARQGSKKRPFYRVVAAEKSSPRDGRFIEQLGIYDPRAKLIRLDQERYAHWVSVGAKPSPSVASLARKLARMEAEAPSAAPPAAKKAESKPAESKPAEAAAAAAAPEAAPAEAAATEAAAAPEADQAADAGGDNG